MNFFKFLISKTFLYQILIAFVSIGLIIFLALKWLKVTTHFNERIQVPNLEKLSFEKSSDVLHGLKLEAKIQDSTNFNPAYPPLSVIEQNPKAGSFVKQRRKIYLVLNPSGYRKVKIPNVIQKTRRQAEPTLRALGFRIGKIIYSPSIAKDVVLELQYQGEIIKSNASLMKTSTIDLVVGDGSK